MALSSSLISQLVKTTNDSSTKTSTSTTVYGTVKYVNNSWYVQPDGSEQLVPVAYTVSLSIGDRVTVSIGDHTAIVTGNLTDQSASSAALENVQTVVTDLGLTVAAANSYLTLLKSTLYISGSDVEVEDAVISIKDGTVTIQGVSITALDSAISVYNSSFEITDGIVTGLKGVDGLTYLTTAELTADHETVANLDATYATIENLNAAVADIESAYIKSATVESLLASYIKADELDASVANILKLTTSELYATVANLGYVTADTVSSTYLRADFANLGLANAETFFATTGILTDMTVSDASITGTLTGVTIYGDCIVANSIVADSLVLKGSDGLYYAINATSETLTASELTDEKYQEYIDGSVLVAESITATQIAAGTITANEIEALTITGDKIAALSITADKLSVNSLSAITANIGNLTIDGYLTTNVSRTTYDQAITGMTMDANGIGGWGSSSQYWTMTTDGVLTAYGAKIYTGMIGAWTLNTGKIYNAGGEDNGTAVMQAPSDSITWVFAAGGSNHSNYTDCPFRVSKAGKLYAEDVNITGAVNATTLNVTNDLWTISNDGSKVLITAVTDDAQGDVYFSLSSSTANLYSYGSTIIYGHQGVFINSDIGTYIAGGDIYLMGNAFTYDVLPDSTNTYYLGSSSWRYKYVYAQYLNISSTATLSGAVTCSSTLTVASTVTLTAGSIVLANGYRLYSKDSGGDSRSLCYLTSDDYYYFGNGGMTNRVYIGTSDYTYAIYLRAENVRAYGDFRCYGWGSETFRVPVPSASTDSNQVAYIASKVNSSGTYYVTINGQFGIEGSTFRSVNFTSTSSDIRLKTNIADTEIEAMPIIRQMQARQFDWIQTAIHQDIGFVADELELLDSGLVFGGGEDSEDGAPNYKSIDTLYLIGYTVKGLQEVDDRVSSLEAQLNAAYLEIAELKAQLAA